jgi:hypothetical protein
MSFGGLDTRVERRRRSSRLGRAAERPTFDAEG